MHRGSAGSAAVLLLAALSLATLLPMGPPRAAADPWIVDNPDGTSDAIWNFTTPGDYTTLGTEISGGVASLRRQTSWWNSTSSADFAGPDSETNIDRARWPGSLAVASTSGTSTLLTIQPGPTGVDAYMNSQQANSNYGPDATLLLDGRGPDRYRPILRFDLSSIPAGAVIDDATLGLYLSAGINNPFTATVHQVTALWDEAQVTWNDRLVGVAWGTNGGDFNAHVVDRVALDNTPGWKTANITQLVDLWYRGRIANYGLVIVAPNTGAHSDKTFHSSEYAANPTWRPKIDIRYRLLGATGEYVSKVGGPGTTANWQTLSWNASARSFVSDEFAGPGLDPKWTWTNAPATWDVGATVPGHLHVVSATGIDLNDGTFTAHVLSDGVVGDFTATLKMTSAPTANGQKAGLLVLVAPGDWYAVQKSYVGATSSVNWQAMATADATSTLRADVVSGSPNPAWLRIARVGNAFVSYTSADGLAWTFLDAYTPGFEYPLGVRLAFFAADGMSGVAHSVDVDYLQVTLGADATTTVQTRTGNTNPVDATWSSWSAPHPAPSGSVLSGTSNFVEFRVSFAVTYPDHSPVAGDVNVSWSLYASSGTLETADLVPGDLAEWGDFSVVQALNGQTIAYAYSTDSGGAWTPLSPPASLQAVSTASGRIRFRATFSTSNTLVSPTLGEMRLTYRHRLDHFHVTASAAATAGAPFTVTATAKDAANATLAGWTGSVTLTARLADGVTPGGGTLGTTSLAITAGGSATLATETYTKAETIRIHAEFGAAVGLSDLVAVGPGSVARIIVSPGNVTLLYLDPQAFTGQGFDTYDNPIPGLSFTWAHVGGLGSLSPASGPTTTFTAGTTEGNGTVEASVGAISGTAGVRVASGARPSIAIGSPSPGDHLTGIVRIAYTNSADSVSVRFEYDPGSGWILIGTTAILNGTYVWDTSALDFAAGSLRATVENNRTLTNVTVVTPLEVDNTNPSIALGPVTDDQATTGTITIAYAAAPDTIRVDLSSFDGAWTSLGTDLTVDGSFVWTPAAPVNGVTLRAIATDDVGLQGTAEMQGVGNRTTGLYPPRIQGIPELRTRTGSTYTLNLTFYVSDADTPLASLTLRVSDPANVTPNGGPYPSLGIRYGVGGTYSATLWVSDGTDTAWAVLRISATAGTPPAASAPLPTVVFSEDRLAFNALGSPLTTFFTDPDGDPLTFQVLDAVRLSYAVQANGTLDLMGAADWYGSERLRIRSTDPTAAFAESALYVQVIAVNDAPSIRAIPELVYEAGTEYRLDLRDYVTDVDDNLTDLLVTTDSPYILLEGFVLQLEFPASWDRAEFTITVSDGAAVSTQRVRASFLPTIWDSPLLFALPSAGVIAVVAMFAQRTRWRPAKTFLVDEYGQLIREFTLDPACNVTYEQVVDAGALDAQDKPIKVSRYHAQTVAGDALAVVLLASGPVTPEQMDFAREMLVNIQDKFDLAVKARLEDARALEARASAKRQAVKEDRAALTAQSKAFAGAMDAVTAAQSKLALEVRAVQQKTLDLDQRERRVRDDREAIDRLATELGELRATLEARAARVEELEEDAKSRARALRKREEKIGPAELEVSEREKAVAAAESDLAAKTETLAAKELDVETRERTLEPRETHVRDTETALEAKAKDLEGLRAFLDARSAQVQAQETEVSNRMAAVNAIEERVRPLETELSQREAAVAEVEAAVHAQQTSVEAKAMEAERTLTAAKELDGRTTEDRKALEALATSLEGRRVELDSREAEVGRLEGVVAGRTSEVRLREERLSPLETELSAREKAVAEREVGAKAQEEALGTRTRDLEAQAGALEAAKLKVGEDQVRLDTRTRELDAKHADVERRLTELRELDERLAGRATDVVEREGRIRAWETDAAARDVDLKARDADVRTRAEAVAASESDVKARMKAAESLEADLAARRAALDASTKGNDERREQLETLATEIHEREQAVQSRTAELEALSRQLAEREAFLGKGEAGLGERAEALARTHQELDERERAARERLKKVDILEGALARDQASLAKDREALGAAAKDFETRSASFAAEMQRRAKEVDERRLALEEDLRRFAAERATFDTERTEKTQWIASKEIDLEAREQSVAEKEAALRSQAEENARRLTDLSAREEALEIETDKLERSRADLDTKKADYERLSKSVEGKIADLRAEETRQAEEFRTWQSTLESEQALLKEQKESFEKEISNQREMWADRMLRVQMKEQDVVEREAKIRTDVEWIAKNEDEVKRREKTVSDALRETEALKAQVERARQDLESRSMEVESRDRTLREEAARHESEFGSKVRALEEEKAAFAQARATFERESAVRTHQLQTAETEVAGRTRAVERRESEIKEREDRTTASEATLKKLEERLKLEQADLLMFKRQLEAKQAEIDALQKRSDEQSARLHASLEDFRQSVAAKEAELQAQREGVIRDSNALQEKLGSKAQELVKKEGALAARESTIRAQEQELESRVRELDSKVRQLSAQAAELDAQNASLAKRQHDLDERAGHLEATAEALAVEEARKRREWQQVQQSLKSKQAQVDADASTRFTEITRQMAELENRERALTSGLAQLEIERAKLADAAKAQAQKDADAAAAWSRAEGRQAELRALEEELLRRQHGFESERASWSTKRDMELKQLEDTRDAAGEQASEAERLIVEAQRRVNAAEDAERAAKRQAEELSALQAQLEKRRAEAETAQKALREQKSQHDEVSRRLAVQDKELTDRAKDVQGREERLSTAIQEHAAKTDELKTRQAVLENEAVQLAKERKALETQRAAQEGRRAEVESKAAEVVQRERVLNTELQRAENLMIDLGRKEAEFKGRERSLAAQAEETDRLQKSLAEKEAQFKEGMQAVEKIRQEIEDKLRAVEDDRAVSEKARAEAMTMKDEAEKAKAQADAMQAEVSKNMKFLQKKAVDVLDREEQFRDRDGRLKEAEKALDVRAEILESKERELTAEREERRAQIDRLEAEVEKLRSRLEEAERNAPAGAETEALRQDVEMRVKIIQKKAFDLLDREEKLRKREAELKARALELGVET